MRQIVLDTETTGLEVSDGHRIIEIGCIELRAPAPDRPQTGTVTCGRAAKWSPGALAVHGITNEFLESQPAFAEVAEEFLAFVDGAELVIHNAEFDVGFLDAELAVAGRATRIADHCRVFDTLALARRMHPGQRNNLDALCKRYGVDNSDRDLHGALLDARILADVYLAMSGGQAALGLDASPAGAGTASGARRRSRAAPSASRSSARAKPSWPRTSARSRRSTGPRAGPPSSVPVAPVARKRVPELSLRSCRIGVIGLGYVGLPLAVEFGKHYETTGFDINPERIAELRARRGPHARGGCARNCAPRSACASRRKLKDLKACRVYVVTVPTPIDARQAAGPRRRSSARARPSAGC